MDSQGKAVIKQTNRKATGKCSGPPCGTDARYGIEWACPWKLAELWEAVKHPAPLSLEKGTTNIRCGLGSRQPGNKTY